MKKPISRQYLREADGKSTFHIIWGLQLLGAGHNKETVLNLRVLVGPVLATFRPASLQTLSGHYNTVDPLLPNL